MKLKITQPGVFNAKSEELEVGSTIEVEGDTIPAWLVNKVQPFDTDTSDEDDKDAEAKKLREELKAQAKELQIEYAKNISNEKLKELIDKKLAS